MTNGEIIRKLLNGCDIADEELAKIRICPYNVSETCNIDMECGDCRLKWLKGITMNFERDDWVSCKDRLPDDQRNVLFVYHNPFYSRNEVHYGFYLPKTELHDARWSSKNGPSYNERQIIWWRDVPLAPQYTKD